MYRIMGPAISILAGCGAFQGSSSWTLGGHSSSAASAGEDRGASQATASGRGGGKPFDVNRDCFADASGAGGRIDYHRDPILFWPCFEGGEPGTAEYSSLAHNCDDTNKLLGASLACRIDHRGFDEHYRREAGKAKQLGRESADPGSYCEAVFAVFQARSGGPSTLPDIASHPQVKQEFPGKVKALVCVYDDAVERSGPQRDTAEPLQTVADPSLRRLRRRWRCAAPGPIRRPYAARCTGSRSCWMNSRQTAAVSLAAPAQPGARGSALASDVAQELQALGLLAEDAGDNLDAERASMTSVMTSAAKERAARHARGGSGS